ncbi:MAG: SDR family oxidoreductase [Bacteroidales bacterium]|nr:SDR family oxidoreductase [Bacteroidales bacterium]MBS3775425.1 SDR family oxidoreductase [Bacteroidales bacterium]
MKQNNFSDLKDKVCVITGGAGIIGSALARGLASAGAKTAILEMDFDSAKELSAELKNEYQADSSAYKVDVLDKDNLKEVKEQINGDLGKIDILINCAGGNSPKGTTDKEILSKEDLDDLKGSFFDMSMEGFDFVYSLNFKGSLLPIMVFGEDMLEKQKGTILNISSMAAITTITKVPAYSAAKAAITNFTKWLSVHLAKTGIRVNAMAPGFFLTNQNRFLLKDEEGNLKERGKKIIDNTPFGRFGEVEELVGTTLYLVSDISSFVTGTVIPVDGGFSTWSGV